MSVTFLFPDAAWALFLLPLLWLPLRKRQHRGKLGRQLALRVAVFVCLILAAMQPSLVRSDGEGIHVILLDQRDVLGTDGRIAARRALDRVLADGPSPDHVQIVQLGGQAPQDDARYELVADGSLATALDRGLSAIPLATGGAITLIGNARTTDRHWEDSVAALAERAIPFNSIPLPVTPARPFIADVRVGPARVGEDIRLEATIEGSDDAQHRIAVYSGEDLLARSAAFAIEGGARIALDVPARREGFLPLRVALDDGPDFETLAPVQPAMPVLYLGQRQAGGAAMLQRLLGPGFAVEARSPGSVDPANWPLVMLDDLPASGFPEPAQRQLNRAVSQSGTGLFVSGGLAAFGTGGYAQTPLGAALPVTARQQERQIRPSVALAIVIDSSGSMQGDRLDLAKQVARRTVRKLDANDWVGVVEFYGARQWSVPMHRATDIPDVERSIGRMQAQGASVLFPALQEALYGLMDVDARYRHILVISDGGVTEDRYQQLIRHIADSRINLSTVAVGGQVEDEMSMADWARIGRGRFYSVPDEFNLVEIDFKQPQTKPQPGYRAGSVAVRLQDDRAWWDGLELNGLPPLSGYVPSNPRPQAQTLVSTAGGDPILASWQVGAGRVTSLMTEPLGAGTQNWRDWSGYGSWLGRALATTARQRPDLAVSLMRRSDRVQVIVQRLSGKTISETTPDVTLVGADGEAVRRIDSLEMRAPGLFVADVSLAPDSPARIEVRDGDSLARAADAPSSDKRPQDAMPAAWMLPAALLADRTGGWYSDGPDDAPALQSVSGLNASDLWPWLALLALAFYLVEIAYRRWPSRGREGSA